MKLQVSIILVAALFQLYFGLQLPKQGIKCKSRCFSSADVDRRAEVATTTATTNSPPEPTLTRKEYLIALRNRLFVVDEKLWMQKYCESTQHLFQSKIPKLKADKIDQLKKYREQVLSELPLAQLQKDLQEAKSRKLLYAARHIQRMIANYQRQMPQPLQHVNQIATVSYSGQVMTVMRGHGKLAQHLGYSDSTINRDVRRQFQLPVFSDSGKYVSFLELHFPKDRDNKVSKLSEMDKRSLPKSIKDGELPNREKDPVVLAQQSVLVHEVPQDPEVYGDENPFPVFHSGHLPHVPLFVRFSPDDSTLAMICQTEDDGDVGAEGADAYFGEESAVYKPVAPTSLVLLNWMKYARPGTMSSLPGSERFISRSVASVLQGDAVFFSYTTSCTLNATILAHVEQPADATTGKRWAHGAVLMMKPSGGANETSGWELISEDKGLQEGEGSVVWHTPVCHSAGGGDNVLLVEDGYLVTKSLSRWKRNADGSRSSKRLMRVRGQVQFLVSPDNARVVVIQEDVNIGLQSLVCIEGEGALDPASPSTGVVYEVPTTRPTVAFWWSPDSTKILCMGPAGVTKDDVMTQRQSFRATGEMQLSVFNFPLQEVKDYDVFRPSPYFMKTNVPFFTQYAQVYNPWSPDSRSFLYSTAASTLMHVPLVSQQSCVGQDRWQDLGVNYGTWSRF
eukprot:gene28602-34529_t